MTQTKTKRYLARTLLRWSTEELWSMLTGQFILVFDDGQEILTTAKRTLYSSYAWDFHRDFPNTPLLISHHAQGILQVKPKAGDTGAPKVRRLRADTHLELLGNVMWSVYDTYLPTLTGISEIQFRDQLAERVYRKSNAMYNDLVYRLEENVTSLDVLDFIEVMQHPIVAAANASVQPTQRSIDQTHRQVRSVLESDEYLPHNRLSQAVRSSLVNIEQVLQCVSARGYLTDTDSHLFKIPILRGYAQGFRSFYDSFIESRSAAKALMFSKTPLQQAEYFSRRLQLRSQIVQRLHMTDCGSTRYLRMRVRPSMIENGVVQHPGDLKQLVGMNYVDEDGSLKTIRAGDHHLVGRDLNLRISYKCAHPDPYGVCSACFGELSLSVPVGTNLGQMCCTSLAQESSQKVLSVKHNDGSSVVEGIILEEDNRQYLTVGPDENTYLLSDNLKGKQVRLIVTPDDARNLTDVLEARNVRDLNIAHVAKLATIGIEVSSGPDVPPIIIPISVHLGRRLANMTYDMLEHIKRVRWEIDSNNNYAISMEGWDWSKPMLVLPLMHFNMSDHSQNIATLLESSVDKLQERDKLDPDALMIELFDLVNSKLSVNMAVLGVVLYGGMIVSAEKVDYSLPKPWTTAGIGIMKVTMSSRSLSAAMAYENHREVIVSPDSYVYRNRPEHPFDVVLCPNEVLSKSYALPQASVYYQPQAT